MAIHRVGSISSKNKHVQEVENPGHNFGHDDDRTPNQMSNETGEYDYFECCPN